MGEYSPKDEIEITDDMVRAGLEVLWASGLIPGEDPAHAYVVAQILEAALACHLSAIGKSPCHQKVNQSY